MPPWLNKTDATIYICGLLFLLAVFVLCELWLTYNEQNFNLNGIRIVNSTIFPLDAF
jgi:hypothetical protein